MDIKHIINEEIQNFNESISVFHGSDRKFDDFNIDKIGSGDGKSLGGWGIYFSDDEDVSNRYYIKSGFVRPHEISNGRYFDLDQPLDDSQNIINGLKNLDIDENEIEEFQTDYVEYDVTNKQVYEWLSYVLGSEKQASLFLKGLGYIGNTMKDKWNTDARNYILFDTANIIK